MFFSDVRRRLSASPRASFCVVACLAASAYCSDCRAHDVCFKNGSSESVKVEIVELPGSSTTGFADCFWEIAPGKNIYLTIGGQKVRAADKCVFRITSRLGATLLTATYIDSDGDLAGQFGPADWNKHRALLQGAKIYVRNLSAEPKKLRLTSLTDANGQDRTVDLVVEIAANQQGYWESGGKPLLATGARYTVTGPSGSTTGSIGAANLDTDGDLVLTLGASGSAAGPTATPSTPPPPAPPPANPITPPPSVPAWRRSAVVTQDEEKLKSGISQIAVAAREHAAATADTKDNFANQVLNQLAQTVRREMVTSAMNDLLPGLSDADRKLVVRVMCDGLDNKFNATTVEAMRGSMQRALTDERAGLRDADAVAELIAEIAIAVRDQQKK